MGFNSGFKGLIYFRWLYLSTYVTFQKKPSSIGYSKFSELNVSAGLYLLALPEKNINGYYEGNICAELTFAPCPVSRCDSIINDHIRAVPALRMFCTSQVSSLLCSSDCHAMAQAIVRQAYHCGGMASIPDYFMWYLWWTKWHWDRFFSEYFCYRTSVFFIPAKTYKFNPLNLNLLAPTIVGARINP